MNDLNGNAHDLNEVPSFAGREPLALSNITPNHSAQEDQNTSTAQSQEDVPIPAYSAWFSLSSVNEIEKRAFPEYATEQQLAVYQQARNFIIQTWRSSGKPPVYTSITAIRRHLAMDVASILKLHSFLERWGLINWIPENPTQRVASSPPAPQASRADTQPLKSHVAWDTTVQPAPASKLNIFCNTCGISLSQIENFYHCLKDPSFNLCQQCFLDGRFSSFFFSGDFVRLAHEENTGWTDQELLYLLEGIEMFSTQSTLSNPEIWDRIAAHVQTHTASECIAKFISLPMASSAESDFAFPAGKSLNSIASIVAILSTAVHPSVGARAAQRALSLLKKDLSNEAEITENITTSLPSLAQEQIEQEEKKTRSQLSLLVELLSRKVDVKISMLDALESSLNAELSFLKKTAVDVPAEPTAATRVEKLTH